MAASGGGYRLPLAAAVLALLGTAGDWVQKLPCRTASHWAREGGIFNATHACYTDPVGLAQKYHLASGALPFRDYSLEYPAGTGYVVAGLSRLATGVGGGPDAVIAHYWDLTALLFGLALFLTLLVVSRLAPRPMVAMLLVALGPLMLAELGLNWDLLAVAPAVAGLYAWCRERPLLAASMLGLGAAFKFFPLLLLLAVFLAVRRVLVTPAVVAVAVFAVVQVPAYLFSSAFRNSGAGPRAAASPLASDGFAAFLRALAPVRDGALNGSLRFYVLSFTRGADLDSTPHVISGLLGQTVLSGAGLTAFAVVVAVAIVAVGGWRGSTEVIGLAVVVLVAFLASNKVWSPQYSLWLLPLVAIAGVRTRLILGWQFVEVAAFLTRALYYQHSHDAGTGISFRWYAGVLVIRLIAVGVVTAAALGGRRDRLAPPPLPAETPSVDHSLG